MERGFAGKILWVDLTKKEFTTQKVDDQIYKDFLGGYGLAAKIIFEHQKPKLGPLDEANIMAFMSGLLTNHPAAFNGRWMICGKSPLTGTWGDSNCGGNFAPAIKDIGFDGIFVIGKSEKPVYIFIDHDVMKILDAKELWGEMDARETEEFLQRRYGMDFRVACIGPAGENLSLISGVVNDGGRLAARSGFGALMGSKNLKALCIRGNHVFPAYNSKKVWDHTTRLLEELVTDLNDFGRVMKNCGTAGTVADSAKTGDSPIMNWLGTEEIDFPDDKANKINEYEVTRYETAKYHCVGCPFGCGGKCKIPHLEIEETHRPEYETICGFGTQLLNNDMDSIFQVNEICNRAGLDTISTATTLDWAFEAYEKGKISREITGGLELAWGNSDAVVEVVKQMAANEKFGAKLKDGLQQAVVNLGLQDFEAAAMHVHGQELPMHDCRIPPSKDDWVGGLGLGVGYEVEPTPGRHTSTFPGIDAYLKKDTNARPNLSKVFPKFKSKYEISSNLKLEEIGVEFKNASCGEDIINALGLCNFGFYLGPNPPIVEWANYTNGWERTLDDYMEIGRRIKTVRHAFNIREGIDVASIRMPERARGNPPLKYGPNADSDNVKKWDGLKRAYYVAMGWDEETAIPLKETLDELDLPDVKQALYGLIARAELKSPNEQ